MLKKTLVLMIVSLIFLTSCSSDVTNKVGDIGYDFEMENFDGETLNLSEFQGKTLYVLAWSTTWSTCIQELEFISQVGESINSEQSEILVVNMSKQDDMDDAKEIIESKGLNDLAYFDIKGEFAKFYGIIGVPAAYIIDPEGIIEEIHFGLVTSDEILNKIEE